MAMSQTQRRKAWRNIYMASWLVILMGVVYVQKQNQDALGRSLRRLKSSRNLSNNHRRRKLSSSTKNAIETKTENGRPIIYTYFEYNPDWEKGDFGSPEEQKEMLQTWARSWRNHGWEPKVLYKRHAEKHPYFEKFEEILDKVKIKYYDHICFHRWIAMSMYGGYMSDYDTYPVDMPPETFKILPNSGRFTAYDNNIEGGAIPSLLSGTQEEWRTMMGKILKLMATHKGEFTSDMRVLTELNSKEPGSFVILNLVQSGIPQTPAGKLDCEFLYRRHALAVHYSHRSQEDALKSKFFVESEHPDALSRSHYAKHFQMLYERKCTQEYAAGYKNKDWYKVTVENRKQDMVGMFGANYVSKTA
uniref:Uncharacterized protein n=1 Tax=Ditylum brightwellii TaxID=49249 RepID=A0A7S4VYJ9_9STRA